MKKICLLMIFVVVTVFTGCAGNAGELAKSLATWEKEKERNGSSYKYSVSFQSWAGFGNSTTIVVANDKVVERHHETWNKDDRTSWSEVTPEELGMHNGGEPLKLIEELYEDCRRNVLTKSEKDYYIDLRFYENGILNYCTYAAKECADDCDKGVYIEFFEFL